MTHSGGLAAGTLDESFEDMMRRKLLRLLSMAGVLVTMPCADEQRDQSDYPSITSIRSRRCRRLCDTERTFVARVRDV